MLLYCLPYMWQLLCLLDGNLLPIYSNQVRQIEWDYGATAQHKHYYKGPLKPFQMMSIWATAYEVLCVEVR